MVRWLFLCVYLMFGGYLVGVGVGAYRMPDAALDAGVAALFCSFWFFFAAAGFYLNNAWVVTMANLALAGLAGLFLFLSAVGAYTRAGQSAAMAWASIPTVAGLCGFLFAGQVAAVFSARQSGSAEKPTPNRA